MENVIALNEYAHWSHPDLFGTSAVGWTACEIYTDFVQQHLRKHVTFYSADRRQSFPAETILPQISAQAITARVEVLRQFEEHLRGLPERDFIPGGLCLTIVQCNLIHVLSMFI